jgi:hypothetical protein
MCEKCRQNERYWNRTGRVEKKRGYHGPGVVTCPNCAAIQCEAEAFCWSLTAPASLQDVPEGFYRPYISCRKMVSFKADDHFSGFTCATCGKEWIVQEAG